MKRLALILACIALASCGVHRPGEGEVVFQKRFPTRDVDNEGYILELRERLYFLPHRDYIVEEFVDSSGFYSHPPGTYYKPQ